MKKTEAVSLGAVYIYIYIYTSNLIKEIKNICIIKAVIEA